MQSSVSKHARGVLQVVETAGAEPVFGYSIRMIRAHRLGVVDTNFIILRNARGRCQGMIFIAPAAL